MLLSDIIRDLSDKIEDILECDYLIKLKNLKLKEKESEVEKINNI